jgi:hypothetical protein
MRLIDFQKLRSSTPTLLNSKRSTGQLVPRNLPKLRHGRIKLLLARCTKMQPPDSQFAVIDSRSNEALLGAPNARSLKKQWFPFDFLIVVASCCGTYLVVSSTLRRFGAVSLLGLLLVCPSGYLAGRVRQQPLAHSMTAAGTWILMFVRDGLRASTYDSTRSSNFWNYLIYGATTSLIPGMLVWLASRAGLKREGHRPSAGKDRLL